jgi:hypothetical protein
MIYLGVISNRSRLKIKKGSIFNFFTYLFFINNAIFLLFGMLSIAKTTQHQMIQLLTDNELERMLKKADRALFKAIICICLKALRKIKKALSHDSWSPDPDLKLEPSANERVLITYAVISS